MPSQIRYTRKVLTDLAAESQSINDMMRKLGVPMAGGTHSYLSRRLKFYGIDTSHFNGGRPDYGRRRYTREMLAEAAANSCSISSMLLYLGVRPYDSAYSYMKQRLTQFGIDTSHFSFGKTATDRFASGVIPKDELQAAVAEQFSLAGVIRSLDLAESGSARRLVKKSIALHGLSTSHFSGQGHAKGKSPRNRKSAADILIELPIGSKRVKNVQLRRAMQSRGVPYLCASCGVGNLWHGCELVLEIDHVNGNWLDNQPDNLRFLCPNCHSVTLTYCGRNKQQGASQEAQAA
ncbi:putative RNA-binding Zn-ribbon protein involved in translation (DUF1610 family) [Kitasatospora sp. MAA4]|uniref:HNH endonuclease signature motif containing protein n=1 Tax=Kitasatospora sp. MAA4 TaxID=3035093 RepID=UPI002475E63E|nr:HNH endonuclease signature motif containing protein [Kitasatospora sp. MAA4]MDH6135218.1 putative RNA-binding Zn-ribbon protein involved in translation (DUF1610 family) [Kitasatospora sp. MAA4]